jgi:hypothetical protein
MFSRPRGQQSASAGEGGGEGGNACVRADARARPRERAMSARTLGCFRADAIVLLPGNFITDATMRPSHGRPSGHGPIVRPLSSE